MNDDELEKLQASHMWRLLELIQTRDPDFPLRNAERNMYSQAWGAALTWIEESLNGHPLLSDAEISDAYAAADKLLPKADDGRRLPYGIELDTKRR